MEPPPIVTGERLPDDRPLYEGVNIRFEPLEVIVAFEGITVREAEWFRTGEIGFYLQEIDSLMSLVIDVENVIWCDGLFTAHSGAAQALLAPHADQGYLVMVILVDLATRIVKAWRALETGPAFSRGLFTLWLRSRNRLPLANQEFRRRARELNQRFSPQELAGRAPYQYRSRSGPE